MKSQVNAVKDTPIRIKILKRAFEEGWNLEQVNSELEKHFCERLYARNRYEAGLIYVRCLTFLFSTTTSMVQLSLFLQESLMH